MFYVYIQELQRGMEKLSSLNWGSSHHLNKNIPLCWIAMNCLICTHFLGFTTVKRDNLTSFDFPAYFLITRGKPKHKVSSDFTPLISNLSTWFYIFRELYLRNEMWLLELLHHRQKIFCQWLRNFFYYIKGQIVNILAFSSQSGDLFTTT